MLLQTINSGISSLAASYATFFLLLLNSSLNPIVYCWRYREIREIMKNTVKKIFHITEPSDIKVWTNFYELVSISVTTF